MRIVSIAITLTVGVVIVGVGVLTSLGSGRSPTPVAAVDTTVGLGRVIPDFRFEDLNGQSSSLSEYARDAPVVLAMRDALCPVSRRYGPTTSRLAKEFAERDVRFLYVNVSPLDTPEAMSEDRSRYDLTGAYFHDPQWKIARILGVITTAEVFLVDGDRRLVYRGAIDDQYGIRFTKPRPREHYLRNGIEQLLSGRGIERESSLPEGCYLAADVRQVNHDRHETVQ